MATKVSSRRGITTALFSRAAVFGLVAVSAVFTGACEEGGVGDPCIPEDEFRASFPGFSESEVNIESRSFQCRTRVCLVANFRGRVSCKYGQAANGACLTPDQTKPVEPAVLAQLVDRQPRDAVYCSCRCAGPQANAPYCECPEGFECRELLADIGLGDRQLAGSYCLRNGTYVDDPKKLSEASCTESGSGDGNCGPASDFF